LHDLAKTNDKIISYLDNYQNHISTYVRQYMSLSGINALVKIMPLYV